MKYMSESGPAHGRGKHSHVHARMAKGTGIVAIICMSEWPSTWQDKHNHVQNGPRYG